MSFMVNQKIIYGLRLGVALAGLALGALFAMTNVRAADLDHPYYRHRRRLPTAASGRFSAATAELQDRAASTDEPL